jgi:hypothetical protein
LLELENARLVQKKDGCNFTKNSAIIPRPKRCPIRQNSRNKVLNDVAETTQKKRKQTTCILCIISSIIHKKKTLREGEDDSASLEKQTQNLDMFDCQHVEKLSSMNKPISMSMVEKLTIQPTLAPI